MNYTQIKKLDEKSLKKLTEGVGPSDECLCSLLAPPDEDKKRGVRASIKKAFASFGVGKSRKKNYEVQGQNSVDIPLTFTKGGRGIYTTREEIERTSSCGKCGCDNDKVFLKHSYANIRITAPDIDMESICSCPSNCMPQLKEKLQSSIKVTVEHVSVDPQYSGSRLSSYQPVGRSFSDLTEETIGESENGEKKGEEKERR